MKVLYHIATLRPKYPKAEAITQEVTALSNRFGGEMVYTNPNEVSPIYIPRLLFGLHLLRDLRQKEAALDLHHFYNPDPFPYPYLRLLRRPVIYAITCGVQEREPNLKYFAALDGISVYDERSEKRLRDWGLENVYLTRPGIETERFTCTPQPLGSEIRIMAGSAPWNIEQFKSKGVEALLEAARQYPRLKLTFLWRGVLVEEMKKRVQRLGLEEQVRVINRQVDVNAVLSQQHASITLAEEAGIVKAHPHSLLDSLAAGKPVLVSQAIPMADYVAQTGCGQVVPEVTPEAIMEALAALEENYTRQQRIAQEAGQRDYAMDAMFASFQAMYTAVLNARSNR
ncbi:MAG: glycosyltransferase [Anaerolineae bacterium]|nr:glycosyltransferase [Anaerolineae bacterium]